MALRLPNWLIESDAAPWQTLLVLAAVYGPDKTEGRIPLRVLARQTLLSIPRTITPALDWLEAEGWIARARGHSTRTRNPEGKRLATGRLLGLHPAISAGSFTVIGAEQYEPLTTAEARWNALQRASETRQLRGHVQIDTNPVRTGRDTEVELALDLKALSLKKASQGVLALDDLQEARSISAEGPSWAADFRQSKVKSKGAGDAKLPGTRAAVHAARPSPTSRVA